jgi:hypothetical protein
MKHIIKFSFITEIIAVLGTTAVFADDQQLQNRLAAHRAQAPNDRESTTVGLYNNGSALALTETATQPSESRFELRLNGHGQTIEAYVPVK